MATRRAHVLFQLAAAQIGKHTQAITTQTNMCAYLSFGLFSGYQDIAAGYLSSIHFFFGLYEIVSFPRQICSANWPKIS